MQVFVHVKICPDLCKQGLRQACNGSRQMKYFCLVLTTCLETNGQFVGIRESLNGQKMALFFVNYVSASYGFMLPIFSTFIVTSRRGDLEILGYVMLQWLCDRLPWENNLEDKEYVKNEKIR